MYIKLIEPKMEVRPMDSEMKTRMAPPLGLYTIANIVKNECEIKIINENIEELTFNDTPDLVGITVAVDSLPRAIEIAQIYRAKGVKVIAGGIHITTATQYVPSDAFDSLCIGPAESYFSELLKDLDNGELKQTYFCKSDFKAQNLSSPAYELMDKSKYLYCNVICTSRGCPFRCDFCYNSSENRQYLQRPIKDIIADIKAVNSKHIMFVDDNFIGNPAWTRALVRELKNLNIKWNAAVSTNIVTMPDLLCQMRDSGCQGLFIGFESINQNSIEGVHKVQNSVQDYQKIVDLIHSLGIMINASFVFGLDSDTAETFKDTADWIIKNRIETVTSHILTPYPGTKQYEKFLSQGRLITNDLSKYNTSNVVFKPKQMSEKELYDGYLWIYKEVYSWKNILKRLPKSKKQILPFLAFNIFYRKYGKFTDRLCKIVTYKRIGYIGEYVSRYIH